MERAAKHGNTAALQNTIDKRNAWEEKTSNKYDKKSATADKYSAKYEKASGKAEKYQKKVSEIDAKLAKYDSQINKLSHKEEILKVKLDKINKKDINQNQPKVLPEHNMKAQQLQKLGAKVKFDDLGRIASVTMPSNSSMDDIRKVNKIMTSW